jgi:hypothetical protein
MELHDLDISRQVFDRLDRLGYLVYGEIGLDDTCIHRRITAEDFPRLSHIYQSRFIAAGFDEALLEPSFQTYAPA